MGKSIEDMSDAEIEEFRIGRRQKKADELKAEFERLAKEKFGEDWEKNTGLKLVPLEEALAAAKAGSDKSPAIPPKYRNPNKASETWSGRAFPPKFWFSMLKEAGIDWQTKGNGPKVREFLKKEGFLIEDQERKADKATKKKPVSHESISVPKKG